MKKILATAAALSLMLIACGDESSSTGPDHQSTGDISSVTESSSSIGTGESSSSVLDSLRNVNMKFKGCYESSYNQSALLKEGETDEMPKAYLYENGGKYQLMIPKVYDYCGFEKVMMDVGRSGDTLTLDVKAMIPTACMCTSDHWFDIDASDADINFFALKLYNKKMQVYEVVPGPAPEDPPLSSGIESSSSGAESSSSFALPVESSSSVSAKSSSSVAKVADKHQFVTDANAQCLANGVVDDPLVDGNLDVVPVDTVRVREENLPPVALRYVGTERTGFTLENLSLTCGAELDTLDVDVSGDTVYVKAKFDNTNAQRCICNSKVDFAVENNPAYGHATVLVFDNVAGSNPNTMEIVDMSVVTVEEITGHRLAKDIKLECKNDRQTANAPALAGNSLVMDPIDTTSTKVAVAGRRVGDDGFDTIVIPEVMMPCAIVFESFDVYADNGTLYVKPKVDPDSPITNCICPTRVSFKVEQNEAFSNANYLVFDREEPMPLVNSVPFDASVLKD
ncbi:hypothetical protein [Fibrobacter sp. UWP2]|uniref:hypothetical protein n=1 Tax=Fibrobacter sp. UWP2 TaxID=1896216 RepID=UPI000911543D|nr:hypothetical protein [Fibrobacter sp. UWP2]SHI61226.1 hypothetical protein SAMN05720471_10491 [Fibrobacter sp. UWP2]